MCQNNVSKHVQLYMHVLHLDSKTFPSPIGYTLYQMDYVTWPVRGILPDTE